MSLDKLYKPLIYVKQRSKLIILTIALIGLILTPVELLFYGVLYYCIFYMPILATFHHEYLMHGYIKPKNKFLEYLSLYMYSAYGYSLEQQVEYHAIHHTNGDVIPLRDPTYLRIKKVGIIKHILGLSISRDYTFKYLKFPINNHRGPISKEDWDFFTKYDTLIWFSTLILWLTLFPFWTWIAFFIYPIVIGSITGGFVEVFFHIWKGKDNAWLVLLQGSAAWHKTHHIFHLNKHMDKRLGYQPWDYEGSNINKNWKYLNSQYYFQKLFYTPIIKLDTKNTVN